MKVPSHNEIWRSSVTNFNSTGTNGEIEHNKCVRTSKIYPAFTMKYFM